MKTVCINLGDRSYEIIISPNVLEDSGALLPWIQSNQVFIVTNEIVAPLYLEKLKKALSGKSIEEIILKDGEARKSMNTLEEIFDKMLEIPLDRTATVLALGGGVIGDIAGFAAACYQRGIAFIQIPTTLLSQVDSSVGGKTAVNHSRGKNMIGAFHQPERVLIDPKTLLTLDQRQFSSGMAEVIKYGLINDPDLFQWVALNIESAMNMEPETLEYIIEQSCINKAKIVEQDEREGGVRALLNLGHTFGHAIETVTGYGVWLHGEAVALGMVMSAHMSCLEGNMQDSDLARIKDVLTKANLPVAPSDQFSVSQLRAAMKLDKKVFKGQLRLILLKGIGEAYITSDYSHDALERTLAHFAVG